MKVVFACVHNAGRSQMAAAFFNRLADPRISQAVSAGTCPADSVHSSVIDSMHEVGINLSGQKPKLLTEDLVRDADLLVTMGCGESCPVIPGLQREDWPLEDPKGQSKETVARIRDEIRARVEQLLQTKG